MDHIEIFRTHGAVFSTSRHSRVAHHALPQSARTHYCLSGSRTMVKIVQIRSIFDIFATHSANLIKHGRGNFRVGQAFIVMKIYLRYFQGKHCGIML